ncbi:STAS domain-containing protein [Amycolatopsis sp. CA-128772]|uniref:STAS domain-containing protein n=1 Tax=Amycolatopsis sp. CA-128772 TaxID=2073159 RepID=UPI0018ECDEAA|nr:STAS domain-containing protein [Amycolatopsis sp. CA-128772]
MSLPEGSAGDAEDLLQVHTTTTVASEPDGDPADGDSAEVVMVAATGEVDMLTVPLLADAVSAALARGPGVLVIDLTGVTFLASAGLSVLLQADQAAGAAIAVRVVVIPGSAAERSITAAGVDALLTVVGTRAAALIA